MFREEITLTYLDLIFTYGFWKLMSVIWTPVIIMIGILVLNRREIKYE